MAGDEFFGYDIAKLRQIPYEPPAIEINSFSDALGVGGQYQKALAEYNDHYYSDRSGVPFDEVPEPEDNPDDIEYINAQIMGEQPGTAEFRAQQWARIGNLLSSVQSQLRAQTKTLAEAWESPKAKEIFLTKVGETLAQLDVWHEAVTNNSYALLVLAQIQEEVQDEMRALYAEYQKALKHSSSDGAATMQGVASNVGTGTAQKVRDMEEPGPPSSQSDRMRAEMRETMRTADENKANYDKYARDLAYRLAKRYDPVIQRLAAARAQKITPLNAVNHPEAYGFPVDLKAPGGPPGGPGGGPPGGPGSPPPFGKDKPPLDKDRFDKDKPPFDKDKFDKDFTKNFDKDKLPEGLDKDKLPNPGDAPSLPPPVPPVPPPPPTAPGLRGMPNLPPGTRTALDNALKQLGLPTNGTNTLQVGTQSLNLSANAQFSTTTSATASGLYPPGTISPPPGGIPGQPKQQGKVLGQRPGVSPPPGAQGRTPGAAGQRNPAAATDVPEAFRPPPLSSAPVLGNKKNKRKPGGAKEAPPAQGGTPNATPPVLSNPHRGNGPARTYSEQRALRRKENQRQQATPEIATGAPTGIAPVLSGRFDAVPATSEAPITLRGRAQAPAAHDPHARPEIHADRTTRAPQRAEPAAAEQSAWDVKNPGGPVVATGAADKQQYRPESPGALGSR
jgi:hypothetical protein